MLIGICEIFIIARRLNMEHKTPKHIVAVAGYLTNEKDEVLLAKSTLAIGYMGVARRTGRRRRSARSSNL